MFAEDAMLQKILRRPEVEKCTGLIRAGEVAWSKSSIEGLLRFNSLGIDGTR